MSPSTTSTILDYNGSIILTAAPAEDAPPSIIDRSREVVLTSTMGDSCEGALSKVVDRISGSMTPTEIVKILTRHKCVNITSKIDHDRCEKQPRQGGGWGDVYLGRLKDDRVVAIKCTRLFVGSRDIRGYIKTAAKELYAWSKCKHNNVQELIGLALYQGQIAMVSPWTSEGTLMDYISSKPEADRLKACTEIAIGLNYLHCSLPKIVHGDVKGENVLVSQDGTVKLTDFGNSIIKSLSIRFSSSSRLGGQNGTTRWSAPEIVANEATTEQSDVYSLGMTILEVITGEIPFAGLNETAVVARLLTHKEPPSRPDCCLPQGGDGDKIWGLLRKCWALDPLARPPASGVRSELEQLRLHQTELNPGDHGGRHSIYPICGYTLVYDDDDEDEDDEEDDEEEEEEEE